MTGYTLAFKLAGVFFLCRFKFSAGCLYTLFSTGRIGLFGSIGKRGISGKIYFKNVESEPRGCGVYRTHPL